MGVVAPLRVGVAGPTSGATLLKYARKFGVGAAERVLSGRSKREQDTIAMPTAVVHDLARAQAANPELGIDGVHFFTFGSAARSTRYATDLLAGGVDSVAGTLRGLQS